MGILDVVGDVLNFWQGQIRLDHPVAWSFEVQIDGIRDAGFKSAKGLSDRMTPYRIPECNRQVSKKLYTKRQPGLVTLEQALTFNGKLERWYAEIANFARGGVSPKRNVSIVQLYPVPQYVPLIGGTMVEMTRYSLPNCAIVDLSYPEYDALNGTKLSMMKCVLDPSDIAEVSSMSQFGLLLDAMRLFS